MTIRQLIKKYKQEALEHNRAIHEAWQIFHDNPYASELDEAANTEEIGGRAAIRVYEQVIADLEKLEAEIK